MGVEEKVKSLAWMPWLERNFSPFVASLFKEGAKKESFASLGFKGVGCLASLCQGGFWYESPEVWKDFAAKEGKWLEKNSMRDVTKSLDRFYRVKKKRLEFLAKNPGDPVKQLGEAFGILTAVTTFIWMAHGLEAFYNTRLRSEVPKYVKGDVDKFIGDASFPSKKNAHALMEEAIRKGVSPEKIAEKFGWLKARDLGLEPFNAEDMRRMRKELKPQQPRQKVNIPPQLKKLFSDVQELVFYRTARTDVFYEFISIARPIFKRAAEFYGISYSDLRNYSAQSLVEGKPRRFGKDFALATYAGESVMLDKPLIAYAKAREADSVKGMAAFKGVVRGTVKVLKSTSELGKVRQGDILVTQMTFPAFLPAMMRAAAFVTDEGGITCHAAIVAREMRKPCITGTKIATRVFKDGDFIEVDAEKGVARKIRR